MTVWFFRTAMIGGGYAYDAYVPIADCPHPVFHSVVNDHGEFVKLSEATRPQTLIDMEPGWDRYFAWETHRKAAESRALDMARTVYPELRQVETWPSLWVDVDVGDDAERHAVRKVPLM